MLRTMLSIHQDGAIAWRVRSGKQREHRTSLSILDSFVLDQDWVALRLQSFLFFCQKFYGSLEDTSLISKLYLVAIVFGSSKKLLGRIPETHPSSMQMPSGNIDDPLVVSLPPMNVPRAKLNEPEGLVKEIIALMERIYRAADMYYEA